MSATRPRAARCRFTAGSRNLWRRSPPGCESVPSCRKPLKDKPAPADPKRVGALLWLIGIPIPIIILLFLLF
ncbi:hypothetical protein GR328_26035 [Microvirga makkahensis]|uniref:Uncharacterized protein n=1 Tax=Microvirga makkahensis TaxID=1128670 RepID=A0A7X3SRN6_9HYPH|nr:hypothetical protein [Microvirga makkahensis]